LTGWLAAEICPVEMTDEGLKTALGHVAGSSRLSLRVESTHFLGSARTRFDQQFCAQTSARRRGGLGTVVASTANFGSSDPLPPGYCGGLNRGSGWESWPHEPCVLRQSI
jgi:hypothetical protein